MIWGFPFTNLAFTSVVVKVPWTGKATCEEVYTLVASSGTPQNKWGPQLWTERRKSGCVPALGGPNSLTKARPPSLSQRTI